MPKTSSRIRLQSRSGSALPTTNLYQERKERLTIRRSLILVLALLLISSCSPETRKALGDLAALRDQLIKEFKQKDANLSLLNSNILKISFINSGFNELGVQQQSEKARQIAFFAKEHYSSINRVDEIWVSFVVYRNYLIFHYTDNLATYRFLKSELGTSTVSSAGSKRAIVVSDNSLAGRRDIYLAKNLEVHRSAQGAIMLFVHCNIEGNQMKLPANVALEFSTSSRKKIFTDNPALKISAGNQTLFAGQAKLTDTMGTEGSITQNVSADIPYTRFARLTEENNVTIRLGPTSFELKEDQRQILKQMKRCVEESKCD